MEVLAVRQGDVFSPQYVKMLMGMISRHAGRSMITLTDADTPGETVRLRTNLTGWWSKFELFAPWNRDLRPALYVDLDTYITDDIRDIRPNHEFWMLADFNRPKQGASGMMLIPEDTDEIWSALMSLSGFSGGDQDYLNKFNHRKLQDEFDGIVSYKNDVLSYGRMGRVVCFHGQPKPHESAGWAKSVWDESVGEGNPSRSHVPEGPEETGQGGKAPKLQAL